jgi:hypothetical protein
MKRHGIQVHLGFINRWGLLPDTSKVAPGSLAKRANGLLEIMATDRRRTRFQGHPLQNFPTVATTRPGFAPPLNQLDM